MTAATTTTIDNNIIELTFDADGGVDWYLANDMADFQHTGLRVKSITFVPSATNDVMHIRNDAAGATPDQTGATIFYVKCADVYDQRKTYHDGLYGSTQLWPSIDMTDCTMATEENARVIIEIA